jgi:hypothetical protein
MTNQPPNAVAGLDGSRKVLRVGTLTPMGHVGSLDSQELVNSMVNWQIYERPYAPPSAAGRPPDPVLFDGPLARDLDRGTHGTYSAGLRPGIRFSDGTPMTVQHVVASLGRSPAL